ncbi:hypothetical protein SCORR_v1c10310 (plasmid) [Spiroplasma corruscae]|uniref:Uncharacterized protein n=1 Tax=Spiroplasma corruscae TaxID=216934 RepID=A0A222ERM4_9MOLU|nr:hypothetical protein [Spiroplasma corruscae]ASP28803.1 hypothetical protein SCORR_v1c10310 [Spiroplasma corruscae]
MKDKKVVGVGDIEMFSDRISIRITNKDLLEKIIEFKNKYKVTEYSKAPKFRKSLNDFWQEFLNIGLDLDLLENKKDTMIDLISLAIKKANNRQFAIYEQRTDRLFFKMYNQIELLTKMVSSLVNASALKNELIPLLTENGLIDTKFTMIPDAFYEEKKAIESHYANIYEKLKNKKFEKFDEYKLNKEFENLFNIENELSLGEENQQLVKNNISDKIKNGGNEGNE